MEVYVLILERKLDEEIVINGDITIKVLGFRGKKVKLGIQAPDNITINRKELLDGSR